MFEIEPETGELEVIGWESTRGEWLRGMNIDPSGDISLRRQPEYRQYCRVPHPPGQRQAPIQHTRQYADAGGCGVRSGSLAFVSGREIGLCWRCSGCFR